MENEELNREIKSIWQKFGAVAGKIKPLLYPKFRPVKNSLIGLNPSLTNKIKNALKEEADYKDISNFEEYFKTAKDSDIMRIEELCKKHYKPYFKHFDELFGEGNWEHIDLYFYRETKQNNFKKNYLKIPKKRRDDISDTKEKFAHEQFNLA